MIPYIMTDDNITILNDEAVTISRDNANFEKIREAIRAGDWDKVKELAKPKIDIIKEWTSENGDITVENNVLKYKDKQIDSSLARRMMNMIKDNFDVEFLCKFLENLYKNPSFRAVNELYGFLESSQLPITEDGYFLAYKRINNDYTDIYTGKIDNSIGEIVEMPRNQVNENKDETCSSGLHFAALSYMQHFGCSDVDSEGGDRIVILKIHPADVVSIPSDYNNAKGRCCKYEVIGEHDSTTVPAFTKSVVSICEEDISDEDCNDCCCSELESRVYCNWCGVYVDEIDYCDYCDTCTDCCDCEPEDIH